MSHESLPSSRGSRTVSRDERSGEWKITRSQARNAARAKLILDKTFGRTSDPRVIALANESNHDPETHHPT